MEHPFIREEMLLGPEALERLRGSRVMIFGVGGVGSYAAEGLARAGVGTLTLVDSDTVGLSNLNRQLCALHSTLGRYKSDVMAERIRDINPDCAAVSLPLHYSEETKDTFFAQPCDYIVDAIDLVSCKLSLILTARERNVPILSAMGTGNKLDPSQFEITDISKTQGCHLARIMRKELRERGVLHHTVLYSREEPRKPAALGEAPPPGRRSVPASVSWVPSCAGLMMAGYVVRALIERP
ncbi:MAG: tRNA threonylcarbamoyladenosine dehydratase [Oscillospiraceae bacterium]|nr:tRNA threonylcarbamoyladenosine dehydratase [Oscillospiraceae bacterium]